MKNLLYPFMLFVGTMFLMTSCEEDLGGGGDPTATPPSIALDGSEVTLEPLQAFIVTATATPGDADLRSFAVYEDGTLIDPTRITFNSVFAGANPIILVGDEKTVGFSYDVEVVSHADEAVRTYRFETVDENNNLDSETVTVTTELSVVVTPPTFTYMGGSNVTADPGSIVALDFDATPGSGDLSTVEVWENGVLMTDLSRLYYGDLSTGFDANPYAIPAADQQGFTMKKIYIRAPEAGGTFTYDVRITATDGESATSSVDISTGTALTTTLEGVLLNSAGPAGTGGLDLDTGMGTGSADPLAEIRDLGIDISQPGSDWIRKIEGVNGFDVRLVRPGENGVPETFSFASVNFREAIVGAYDVSPLNEWITEEGDIYAVANGTNYYLLETIEVNEKAAPGDNSDFYRFNVKF